MPAKSKKDTAALHALYFALLSDEVARAAFVALLVGNDDYARDTVKSVQALPASQGRLILLTQMQGDPRVTKQATAGIMYQLNGVPKADHVDKDRSVL